MVFSLRHCLELLLVKIHLLLQVLREKTRASAVSEVSGPCKSVMDLSQPFIHDGSVSLSTDTSNSIPIKILTGTGASQSPLLSDTLVFSEKSSTCASVLIRGISSKYTPVPPYTQYTPVYTSSCQCYCHRQAWLRKVSRASREENSPSVPIMCRDASHK